MIIKFSSIKNFFFKTSRIFNINSIEVLDNKLSDNSNNERSNNSKAIRISEVFFNFLKEGKKNNYVNFIKERDIFLQKIGEGEMIEYLGGERMYKMDDHGIQNFSKIKNSKNKSIITFFHILGIPSFHLEKLSVICSLLKNENKIISVEGEKKFLEFYIDNAIDIMGINKDKDARLSKWNHLERLVLINGNEYEDFSNKTLNNFLDEILEKYNLQDKLQNFQKKNVKIHSF